MESLIEHYLGSMLNMKAIHPCIKLCKLVKIWHDNFYRQLVHYTPELLIIILCTLFINAENILNKFLDLLLQVRIFQNSCESTDSNRPQFVPAEKTVLIA